jgi:hypothetical protein
MTSTEFPRVTALWAQLATYRQRYDIEDRIGTIRSLERSMARREMSLRGRTVRLKELEHQIKEERRAIKALESELEGSRRAGALLIEEILDEVRIENGEAWSPVPVRGFRAWRVADNRLHGSQSPWTSATYEATCLRSVPNDDIPHSEQICGPPACGIYATKTMEKYPTSITGALAEDHAFGVVAMTGKVVEHSGGYRSECANVVALAVRSDRRWLVTAKPDEIEAIFQDPERAIAEHGHTGYASPFRVQHFLEHWKRKEERWISDQRPE